MRRDSVAINCTVPFHGPKTHVKTRLKSQLAPCTAPKNRKQSFALRLILVPKWCLEQSQWRFALNDHIFLL